VTRVESLLVLAEGFTPADWLELSLTALDYSGASAALQSRVHTACADHAHTVKADPDRFDTIPAPPPSSHEDLHDLVELTSAVRERASDSASRIAAMRKVGAR
jgi:hypothetical protein